MKKGEQMKATPKTRTQRRMEKRQAIILLVLVLVVSLASFTLGVLTGRRGAERDLAQQQQAEKVLVVQTPATTGEPVTASVPKSGSEVQSDDIVVTEQKLSFYDDLSKETAPIGSGINLAPVEKQVVPKVIAPPIELPAQPIVKKSTDAPTVVATKVEPKPVPEVSKTQLPPVTTGGSHAVQIGSFGAATDAIALKKRMLKKGCPAYVVEADLGKKGLWYRVKIGPYAGSDVAKNAQKVLEEREKIKGFVSRR